MRTNKHLRNGFGLFRNFGWKKNLLAVVVSFLIVLALEFIVYKFANNQMLRRFDPGIATVPLIGFLLGIWGVIGVLLESVVTSVQFILDLGKYATSIHWFYFVGSFVSMFLHCALPSMLWYAFPGKGEERASYPRLDTSGHVVKYYLIMVVNCAVFVLLNNIWFVNTSVQFEWLETLVMFTQYLNVTLIIGMPLVIVVSVMRNRTFTINERMVLTFLAVCVIASLLCAGILYRTIWHLEPDVIQEYNYLMRPEVQDLAEEDLAIVDRYNDFWNWYYVVLAIMLNVLLIIEMLLMRLIESKVTMPIVHLSDVLEEYKAHEEGDLDPETVTKRCKPYRYGYGEVSSLTRTCVELVNEIDSYTENLREVTAEKQRIGTELDVASKIQRDMLPRIFPPFPGRHEMDLFASMTPAKEVGGDFYDFYFIDHDHLVLTIADVSGKGVPASLFMVISKTLLKNYAQGGGSPKEILTYVNHQLCQNNDSFMFCTVWLGILNLKTGKLKVSNAGHEYPAIRRKDGSFELLEDQHNAPLGVRDGIRYRQYELTLQPGDCIFEYTDGVTEATDSAYELFGEERMIQVLNEDPVASPESLIERMHSSISTFVGEAPQFDDITMLCLEYRGAEEGDGEQEARLTVPARTESLDEVTEFVQKQLENVDCQDEDLFNFTLAAEEIFVNIAEYAYEGAEGEAHITFMFDEDERIAEFVFTDGGMPFDPTCRPAPDTTLKPGERQIGGLGIHIVKKTMDQVIYRYEGGENHLTIRKQI